MGKDLKGKELGRGISQRKNGKYEARFINRFGKRESVTGSTIKEVKNKFAQAQADDIRKSNVVSKTVSLDEWYQKWMTAYKTPVVRENTEIYYNYVYNTKISPTLGKTKLTDLTKIQIVDLLHQLKEQGYGWETLNKVKLMLNDMLNRAQEDEFVSRNAVKGVQLPILRKKAVCNVLSKEEQKDFLECSSGQFYHNLFVVALNTGLRPGELFALTEKDLNFKNNTINVSKTLLYEKFKDDTQKEFHIGDPKTYTSIRTVPMNEICKNALIKQLMQAKVIRDKLRNIPSKKGRAEQFSDLIFTTKFGTPINAQIFNQAIIKVVMEVNSMKDEIEKIPNISGHSLRHTFATRCFEAGVPPKTVQTYLGHASLQMTMDLYTSVLDKKKQDDMRLLEASIGIEPQDISKYSDKIIQFHAS